MKKVPINYLIFSLVGFLMSLNPVFAATETIKIYSTQGDGNISTAPYPGSWSEQHNTSEGRVVVDAGQDLYTQTSIMDNSGYLEITRGFVSFDTAQIPDNAKIISAKIGLYGVGTYDDYHDQNSYVGLFKGFQVSVNTLSVSDIDNCGQATDSLGYLADKKYLADIPVNQFNFFNLNSAGLTTIDKQNYTRFCLRTGGDAENIEIQKINPNLIWNAVSVHFSSSETVGTDKDPYLEITYEVPETNRFPLYTQTVSPYPSIAETTSWANEPFAGGTAGAHCPTIAACGCTITSTVMLARSYGITKGIDGSEVNPGNFNRWLTANHGYKGAGNLDFSQGMKYFGIEENGVQKSYFKSKDSPLSDSAVRQRVSSGVPVVSQMNAKFRRNSEERGPHFVLVTELLGGGQYGVNDPIWFNTKNLDDDVNRASMVQDYNDHITNGRDLTFSRTPAVVANAFSSSLIGQAAGALTAAVFVRTSALLASGGQSESGTAPAEMFMSTPGGGRLGYDPRGGQSYKLTNGYYGNEAFLSDPLDENTPPVTDVLKTLSASELSTGQHKVYVIGTGTGTYKYAGLVHDAGGHEHPFMYTTETASGMVDVYQFDVTTGEFKLLPIDALLFKGVIDGEIKDATLNRFFTMWAEKIMGEIKDGKMTQAREHIETFKTLMKAKKVDSPALNLLLQKLAAQVG